MTEILEPRHRLHAQGLLPLSTDIQKDAGVSLVCCRTMSVDALSWCGRKEDYDGRLGSVCMGGAGVPQAGGGCGDGVIGDLRR
jgi:hypothetical protein